MPGVPAEEPVWPPLELLFPPLELWLPLGDGEPPGICEPDGICEPPDDGDPLLLGEGVLGELEPPDEDGELGGIGIPPGIDGGLGMELELLLQPARAMSTHSPAAAPVARSKGRPAARRGDGTPWSGL